MNNIGVLSHSYDEYKKDWKSRGKFVLKVFWILYYIIQGNIVYNTWWEFTKSAVPHGCIKCIPPHCNGGLNAKNPLCTNKNPLCKCVSKQRNITYYPQQASYVIFFHKACPIESSVLSFNNSPKCIIKIFLESLKTAILLTRLKNRN